MNFYHFNIGDYAGKTRHLTWDEDMAYRRMLDAYYSHETPLPLDRRGVYRLVGASEERQRAAVDAVLGEFFEERHDGWHNNRADEEIAKTHTKKAKAQASAAVRWQNGAHSERTANAPIDRANASDESATAQRPQSEGNAPSPSPSPSPNSRGDRLARAPNSDAELEAQLRVAAGWNTHTNPNLAITGPIVALLDNGADLDLDVLPVIRALAPQVRSPNWPYFVNAIAEARDRRIAAATIVSTPSTSQRSNHAAARSKPSRDETFAAIDRRIEQLAEAERRSAGGSPEHPEGLAEGEA